MRVLPGGSDAAADRREGNGALRGRHASCPRLLSGRAGPDAARRRQTVLRLGRRPQARAPVVRAGSSIETTMMPGGVIPPHDGTGPVHVGFGVDVAELSRWEEHLNTHRVQILTQMNWPRGGRSVYFRDPDGHLLELLTPGVWETY